MMIDVIRSVAELRQRRLESEDIELHIEDRATQAGEGRADRAAAGGAELRGQRRAGDSSRPDGCLAASRSAPTTATVASCSKSRTPAPASARTERGEAVSAVLHHQAGGPGDRPRSVDQLRHHRFARRRHRLPNGARRWSHLLFRSAGHLDDVPAADRRTYRPSPRSPGYDGLPFFSIDSTISRAVATTL